MAKSFIGHGNYYFFVYPKDSICDSFDADTFAKCFSFESIDDARKCHSYFSSLFEALNCSDYDFVGDGFEVSNLCEVK